MINQSPAKALVHLCDTLSSLADAVIFLVFNSKPFRIFVSDYKCLSNLILQKSLRKLNAKFTLLPHGQFELPDSVKLPTVKNLQELHPVFYKLRSNMLTTAEPSLSVSKLNIIYLSYPSIVAGQDTNHQCNDSCLFRLIYDKLSFRYSCKQYILLKSKSEGSIKSNRFPYAKSLNTLDSDFWNHSSNKVNNVLFIGHKIGRGHASFLKKYPNTLIVVASPCQQILSDIFNMFHTFLDKPYQKATLLNHLYSNAKQILFIVTIFATSPQEAFRFYILKKLSRKFYLQ